MRTVKEKDIKKNKARAQHDLNKTLLPFKVALILLCILSFFYAVFDWHAALFPLRVYGPLAALAGLLGALATKSKDDRFFAFLGISSLVIGVPLFINKVSAESTVLTVKLPIIDRREGAGRSGPSVDIQFDGIQKEIPADDNDEMERSKYVVMKFSKGGIGYYVIRDTKLVVQ